ncbi:hypothetical protein [Pseudoalteromonas sp. SR43-5]|uniref:hypothetical protein n=1 Tax=Pseudoalteromonas sp. SR43-5 TaxID=2760941 RepID=UPI0015FA5CEA|nr:hypothetical protein [Pseudoalteromonas sp. SR43-5]MBB1307272.1 hypothetical protein [Pseudoalteromonas sp. SR43-5]
MLHYFNFLKSLEHLGFKMDEEKESDQVVAQELNVKTMNVPRSAGHRSGDFHSQATGYMTGKPRSIGHGPVSIVNERNIPRGTFEKVGSENPCDIAQRGRDELNAQYFKQQLDTEHLNPFISFVEMANKKPLEPWQKHFLELALRAKNAGESLTILPSPRGRNLVNLSVTICAFDVMHDLVQSEFEKAVLLKREVAKDFILLPFINHYLARAVFFAQLSQQTNNIVHINKAYKRAHLVCMVLKYFLKDKHTNLAPSARLRTAIKKGLYA